METLRLTLIPRTTDADAYGNSYAREERNILVSILGARRLLLHLASTTRKPNYIAHMAAARAAFPMLSLLVVKELSDDVRASVVTRRK